VAIAEIPDTTTTTGEDRIGQTREREIERGQQRTLGAGVAGSAARRWNDRSKLTTARCGRTPVWKTPVDASKFKGFLAVSLAVIWIAGLTGRQSATRQRGKIPTLGTDLTGIGARSSWLVDVVP